MTLKAARPARRPQHGAEMGVGDGDHTRRQRTLHVDHLLMTMTSPGHVTGSSPAARVRVVSHRCPVTSQQTMSQSTAAGKQNAVQQARRSTQLFASNQIYSKIWQHELCKCGSVAQWLGRWLVIERSRVRLPAKQYNLVPAKGRRRSAAGKVTVGLASHWPCVTDSVVYPPTGSTVLTGR